MKFMKAIVYETYGPPDVLQIKEVQKPVPRQNEVLIKIRATEVTKSDCEMRSFRFQVKWFWLPLRVALGITKPRRQILGGYFSGKVAAVGKNVSKFKPGDEVFGCAKLRMGAYGEYICLPASYTIAPKPSNVSFEEAAAIPLGGLNALHFLRKANIRKGEKVLVNGAGGSIGTFGVQIAKAFGAEVTAVDSPLKEKMLRRIGADCFLDYTQSDVTKTDRTYDVILNMVATTPYAAVIRALNPKGRYLTANPRLTDMMRSLLTTALTDKTATFAFAGEKVEELLTLKTMIEQDEIKPVVDRAYPFNQIVEAHQRVETEQRQGPVVITMETHI